MLTPLPTHVTSHLTASQALDMEHTAPIEDHPGVYTGWGFDHGFDEVFERQPWFEPPRLSADEDEDRWWANVRAALDLMDREDRTTYGLADSLEQILERLPWLAADEQHYVLVVTLVPRESEPGFRPHKNGPYIGTQELGEELGDSAPEVTEVVLFVVHEYRPGLVPGPLEPGYETRLTELADLQDGWDDGLGTAPSADALARARGLLSLLPPLDGRTYGVLPTGTGGVLVEALAPVADPRHVVSIEVDPDEPVLELLVLTVSDDGPGRTVVEESLPSPARVVARIAAALPDLT